ncbi:NADH:ubiquinone reductase (Na(+)-transporting) subunit D [bacterium]|nr:NADH:ubiquinone reductase (Na(+)-transporting) subunit D [bacterium]
MAKKGNLSVLTDPLWDSNPVMFQVLGICSSLAVTTQLVPSLIMAAGVTFVVCLSNVTISLMRNYIPNKVRIIVQLSVVSALVIMIDQLLRAYLYEQSKDLSVFVGLIITNCIVMGRLEAFAMSNPPWPSFLDGLGNSLGYSGVLVVVATVREILGNGAILGFKVVPQAFYDAGYQNFGLMLLPPGAFIILGLLVWLQRAISNKVID